MRNILMKLNQEDLSCMTYFEQRECVKKMSFCDHYHRQHHDTDRCIDFIEKFRSFVQIAQLALRRFVRHSNNRDRQLKFKRRTQRAIS